MHVYMIMYTYGPLILSNSKKHTRQTNTGKYMPSTTNGSMGGTINIYTHIQVHVYKHTEASMHSRAIIHILGYAVRIASRVHAARVFKKFTYTTSAFEWQWCSVIGSFAICGESLEPKENQGT